MNLAITWVLPSSSFGVIDISTYFIIEWQVAATNISSRHLWKIVKIFCVEKQGFIILEIGMKNEKIMVCSILLQKSVFR